MRIRSCSLPYPFLYLVAALSASQANQESPLPKPVAPQSWDGRVATLPVRLGEPVFRFEVDRSDSSIRVYRPGSTAPDQVLRPAVTEPPPRGSSGLSANDYDGDGYLDLEVLDWWGATGNFGNLVYLYHPRDGLFQHSPMYSANSQPQPDGSGCVYSRSVGGHAGYIYAMDYSCPQGERLIPRWTERQDWDEERDRYVFQRQEWNPEQRLIRSITEHHGHVDGRFGTTWAEEYAWREEKSGYEKTTRNWNGRSMVVISREIVFEEPPSSLRTNPSPPA